MMKGTGGVAVNGCGKRGVGYQQMVWFLGKGNRDEGYQQRVWFLWGWGNRVRLEGLRVLSKGVVLLLMG